MRVHTETLQRVDGQRQPGISPGIAVLTPPLRPARGRDQDQVFVMLLDVEAAVPSRLCRQVREAAAQSFWNTPGGVTAALRRAVAAANQVLLSYNLHHADAPPFHGAFSCGALRADEFFLAQAGPAQAFAVTGGRLQKFPHQLLPALGSDTYVESCVAYLPVQAGDLLLLASHELSRAASDDALQRALSLADPDALRNGLEQVAEEQDFFAVLAQWLADEAPGAPSPSARRRRISLAPPLPLSALKRVFLPQAALPPEVEEIARPADYAAGQTSDALGGAEPEADDLTAQYGVPAPTALRWEPEPNGGEAESVAPPILPVIRREAPADAMAARAPRTSLVERLRIAQRLRRAGGWLLGLSMEVRGGLQTLFRRALPGRAPRAQPRTTQERQPPPENKKLMIGIAIAILVITILVTLWTWFNYGSRVREQQVLSEASQYAAQARESTDPLQQRAHWEAVLAVLAAVEGNPQAAQLAAEAQDALDRLDHVIRVDPVLLWAPDAALSARRLVARGSSLFFLDVENQAVAQLALAAGGVGGSSQVATILAMGEERDDQQVAALVDMAWNPPGGEWAFDRLVVLDADSQLWAYDPAWPDATCRLPLGSNPEAGVPVALSTFGGRLFLLDPMADQIWRYWPHGGGYAEPPDSYFADDGPPQPLQFALDLAIDGNVYVLLADGQIAKYFDGEPMPFAVTDVPPPQPAFVAVAVAPDRVDGLLYLADAVDARIVILDHTGDFQAQLRASADVLQGVQSLALDDMGSRIFFLTQNGVYTAPLPALSPVPSG
ncbi:MAG: hypothetical protein JW900_02450 [Anaerolineae bacterium]|nr:hypothetical protein [Anaerolineae bacterium]